MCHDPWKADHRRHWWDIRFSRDEWGQLIGGRGLENRRVWLCITGASFLRCESGGHFTKEHPNWLSRASMAAASKEVILDLTLIDLILSAIVLIESCHYVLGHVRPTFHNPSEWPRIHLTGLCLMVCQSFSPIPFYLYHSLSSRCLQHPANHHSLQAAPWHKYKQRTTLSHRCGKRSRGCWEYNTQPGWGHCWWP